MDFVLLKAQSGNVITGIVAIAEPFVKHAATVTVAVASASSPNNALQTVRLPLSRFFEFAPLPVRDPLPQIITVGLGHHLVVWLV